MLDRLQVPFFRSSVWLTRNQAQLISFGGMCLTNCTTQLIFAEIVTFFILHQGTRFGAMLDQLTDRAATACLVVTLSSFYPKYMFWFQIR